MPESTDDTHTPRPDHHTYTSWTALAEHYGPHYADVIDEAAGLRFTLNMSAPELDLDNAEQLTHRAQLLWKLHGRRLAATVLLGSLGELESAELAELHIASLAVTKEQDATDTYRQS